MGQQGKVKAPLVGDTAKTSYGINLGEDELEMLYSYCPSLASVASEANHKKLLRECSL